MEMVIILNMIMVNQLGSEALRRKHIDTGIKRLKKLGLKIDNDYVVDS